MISILSLLMVMTLSILVTRIATVALTYTGLSRESAKFQARSAFTGVGFTTTESEKAVNHPIRRRILLMLMLLGNAGVITAVSSLIISFVNVRESDSYILNIFLLITGVVLLWSLASSKWVDRHLSNFIAKVLKRYTRLNVQDFSKLLHLAGDYQITELHVNKKDWIADKALAEVGLRDEGVVVLGIERQNGDYLGVPDGETEIRAGDILIVYGMGGSIEEIDQRGGGREAEAEHRRKVADQQRRKEREKRQDIEQQQQDASKS
ncbi:MAG: TrkA C-terminal domain-containing protein [Desulfocapsaceae bacterium]|nr:TrkA C-terminal domain-containing protein [Desulfocapsaceae bacterium]